MSSLSAGPHAVLRLTLLKWIAELMSPISNTSPLAASVPATSNPPVPVVETVSVYRVLVFLKAISFKMPVACEGHL